MSDSADPPTPPMPAAPRVAEDTLVIVEAIVLCAGRKLSLDEMLDAFDGTMPREELLVLLAALEKRWHDRGFELAHAEGLWWARARPDAQAAIQRADPTSAPARASKAFLETLAIIAYTQPCTKSDIEQRRGMSVTPAVFEQLEARGWIEVIGHRNAPQSPALYATTNKFLDDLGLFTLEDLPSVDPEELAAGPSEATEVDFDAYVPYDGPMPLLPGETAESAPAAAPSATSAEGNDRPTTPGGAEV